MGTDLPASACDAIVGIEKRQLAEFEIVLHADKPDLRNLAAMYGAPVGPAAVMLGNERGEVNRPRRRELRAGDAHTLLNHLLVLLRLNILRHELIIGVGRQSENTAIAEEKNAKKNSDWVQRAYYLDRDIDKALRRMALEEDKNLTESVNDALRAGLTKYL